MRGNRLLAALATLALGAALVGQPAAAATVLAVSLSSGLDSSVARFRGAAALVVSDRAVGYRYAYAEDRIFYAASLYKLGVMVEAYRQAAAGLVSLDETAVTIAEADTGPDGWYTPAGSTLTLREAISRMITLSDNSPASALLRLLDTHSVNATTAALGLRNTRINTGLPETEQTLPYNTTSARDMEKLFLGLLGGTVVSPAASGEMLEILKQQRVNDRLPAGAPAGTTIAHKTGNLDGVAHDAGILYTPAGPRIVVLLTGNFDAYEDVTALAQSVAGAVYEAHIDRLSAAVNAVATLPTNAPAAEALPLSLVVTNTSTFAWRDNVRLGAHWRNAEGRYVRWDSARAALPPLLPGESATVDAEERVPNAEGDFTLEWEVVEEGVAWSGDLLAIPLHVVATAESRALPLFVAVEGAQSAAERARQPRDVDEPRSTGPDTPVGPRRDRPLGPTSGALPSGPPQGPAPGSLGWASATGSTASAQDASLAGTAPGPTQGATTPPQDSATQSGASAPRGPTAPVDASGVASAPSPQQDVTSTRTGAAGAGPLGQASHGLASGATGTAFSGHGVRGDIVASKSAQPHGARADRATAAHLLRDSHTAPKELVKAAHRRK